MTWNRHFLLLIALLVGASLIASTTGFSSVAADRNANIAVASDDEAYLGIQAECNDSALQVSITNRFSSGTTLDITVAVNGTVRTIDGLAAGGQETVQFDMFNTDDPITIDATGSGTSVYLTRSLPTGC